MTATAVPSASASSRAQRRLHVGWWLPAGVAALRILRSHPIGEEASIIGSVTKKAPGLVTLESRIGATRIVDMLSGEQLPRIC